MRRRALAAVFLAGVLALAACGDPEPEGGAAPPPSPDTSEGSPSADPFDPDATMQPDLMRVEPSVAEAGQEVLVTYPGGRDRGVAYVLERASGASWDTTHLMTAVTNGFGTEPSFVSTDDAAGYGWEDIGVGGEGPDRLVVPDVAPPGTYRICTANSRENICTVIEIVAIGDAPIPVEPDGGIGDGAGPPPAEWLYGEPRAELDALLGRAVDEFEAGVADLGWGPVRIAVVDGEPQDLTDDLVPGRVNVAVEQRDGAEVVVDARIEADPDTGALGNEATVVSVHDGVEFYPACGNESLTHGGVDWYQVQRNEHPETYDRAVGGAREQAPESVMVRGFAPRVAEPGPGDDVGTLVIWSDEVAYFVSDSGDLSAWLVTDELEYGWEC